MKKALLLILLGSMILSCQIKATKLVEVRVIDEKFVMVYFMDGEVTFKDNGQGESAFTGHDWAEGDDALTLFGKGLDVEAAASPKSWKLLSLNDPTYTKALNPDAAFRKSKVLNTTNTWEYCLDHWIYLKLPESLKPGASYTLIVGKKTNSDQSSIEFTYNLESCLSEAIHVNMIAYAPESPVKSADLYLWMGDGGERDYSSFEGNAVYLYNTETKERTEVAKVRFWKELSEAEAYNRNLTGSKVWNIDFSDFNKVGKYKLLVEGVGASREFEIRNTAFYEPYKYSVRGYYYMRIGEDRMDMKPVPRRPTFIPGKDPEGFTIYLTDLHPFHPSWREHRGDTWDEPHFKPAAESMFWQHRLEGNPTNSKAIGGHSDALDWDRHLAHVSNIYDLLFPYFLSGGKTNEDNLDIGESGNGIPDLIDEARNEVDFWLSCRDGEAYCHGLTNPSSERTVMFQAGKTNMAAWANAANCAIIADCFRLSGHKELQEYYTKEAIKAFRFAESEEKQMLDLKQDVGDGSMRGRDFMQMAAAFLYNSTGDTQWEDIMANESVALDDNSNLEDRKNGIQIWATAAYLFTPQKRNFPELYEHMKASVRNRAMSHNVVNMDLRPSRRSSNDNYWQTPHNMHLVVLAHAISEDSEERKLLEKSMVLEADWGLGRNPANIVEMTGLGERHIINCYTSGRNDGTPGLHPGHTPYNNLDAWGRGNIHNGANPPWFVEKCYPEWKSGGWPHQEGFFNSRYSWANGEFTPRQTMRGKMVLLGYLHSIYSFD
jgi:hypothetical protein